jgi:hypothetical protein
MSAWEELSSHLRARYIALTVATTKAAAMDETPGGIPWIGENPQPPRDGPFCPAMVWNPRALDLQCEREPGHDGDHTATYTWCDE